MGINSFIFNYLSFLILLFSGASLCAQNNMGSSKELGLPFITNYAPKEYNAFDQNWGFAQDSVGVLYVANGDGILTYDGAEWGLLELPNKGAIRSLNKGRDGKIYVGADNEIGYVEPDSIGRLKYVSLVPFMNESQKKSIGLVRAIHVMDESIYFQGGRTLFKWNGQNFKTWKNEKNAPMRAYKVNGHIYVQDIDRGLLKLGNDFELIPNSLFLNEKNVWFMLSLNKNDILIGTDNELFLYDGKLFTPFKIDYPEFLRNNWILKAIKLDNNVIVIGSQKGILIIDENGRQVTTIVGKEMLRSNQILALFQDDSGILWAGLQSGIAKIEYPSPFSTFSEANGLIGKVRQIVRYDKKLYAATLNGLYRLENDEVKKIAFFKPYGEIYDPSFDIITCQGDMIIGARGLFYKSKKSAPKFINHALIYDISQSRIDTNRVFIGHTSGVYSIYKREGAWVEDSVIVGPNLAAHKIVEDTNGNLWVRTNTNRLAKISSENKTYSDGPSKTKIDFFDSKNGLPDEIGNIRMIHNELFYTTKHGSYLFDDETNGFGFDKILYKKLGFENQDISIENVDENGNIWVSLYGHDSERFISWNQGKGSYVKKSLNEERISDKVRGGAFMETKDSVIWYKGTSSGIIRHDLNKHFNDDHTKSRTIISGVKYNNDSLLFGGWGETVTAKLPFLNNSFRFQYASPNFYEEDKNQFQYKLEGFDDAWSDWTLETQKDYTNIPEGNYTFKVRGKNIFNKISEEDSYSFIILPPWYRSWWAYLAYSLLGVLGIWGLSSLRSRQLKAKNLKLEGVVAERTREIAQKNRQLQYQTEKLKEMDTMKTRLFSNISHEFRTPLTLIKGPIEKMEHTGGNTLSTTNVKMIRRNANRLLNLVNQLLDLSKLDSGKLKLAPTEGDIFKCIRAATSSFGSHAAARDMDYQVKVPPEQLWASFDRDKLEKIVYNLLSNAFKFTEDKGTVVLEVGYRNGRLKMKIRDTGQGIAQDKLPYIFDRFYQVDDSYTREKTGSGIGLALTKELAELMGGTLFVESEEQLGTLFRLVLPIEKIETRKEAETTEESDDNDDFQVVDKETSTAVDRNDDYPLVLIIEDNNDMRHFIREQLEPDFQIEEAVNGKLGLEQAKKKVPDLIITDLMMPQMDGITLCKRLKTDRVTSHIPVIMLTAKAGIENKLVGLETGADDYLTKPFHARELLVRSKNLIQQRKQLRELFATNDKVAPKEITVTGTDEKFLTKTFDLLEKNYDDSEFGVPQMQTELAMSKTQLYRKIKALTDLAPGELLRTFRLKRAAQLLRQDGGNVTEIAYTVGFNSVSYFVKCFREHYGQTPHKYKA